jgi:zinc transport system substrate-binding protein
MLLSVSAGVSAAPPPPTVVVTIPPQAYFVERLAGGTVAIEVMVPTGANPELYEPNMKQLDALRRAVLYVKIGHPNLPFERTWLPRLLSANQHVTVVDSMADQPVDDGDPHVWVSPARVRAMVPIIAAALVSLRPEGRPTIEARQAEFLGELDALDRQIRSMFRDVARRRFYVFHPAWTHFAKDYGLEQVAIETDHKEPNPHELGRVLARARADAVAVIFVQPQFSRRSADLIASEIGARIVVLDPLARDWLTNLSRVAQALRQSFPP